MTRSADELLHRPERETNVRIVRLTSSVACFSLGSYAALAAVGGLARPGPWTAPLWVAAALAIVMGIVWALTDVLLETVPVFGFVIVSDIGIAVAISSLADPRLTLLAGGLFVITGSFAGYHTHVGVFVCHIVFAVTFLIWAAARLPLDAELVIETSILMWLVLGLPWVARALWSSERRRADRAFRDPLTDTANRAGLERAFPRLCEAVAPNGLDMCVLAVDLDDFKSVNDTYGHATGDAVIVDTSRHLRDHLGPDALIARTGGEEFTIVMSGHGHRLRSAVDRLPLTLVGQSGPTVTMSVGAVWVPVSQGTADLGAVTTAADTAMYEAKRAGGNRLRSLL